MASKGLSDRQKRFIDAYLTCWNAAEAARQAGYSKKTARAIGAENLTKPDIRAAIDARLTKMSMSADEVLARLTAHASGSLAPFLVVDGENVGLDLTTPEAQENIGLIKKIKTKRRRYGKADDETEEFETEIELYDAQAALIQIGRHHGAFVDKIETDVPILIRVDK